jgi:hypothetical protein
MSGGKNVKAPVGTNELSPDLTYGTTYNDPIFELSCAFTLNLLAQVCATPPEEKLAYAFAQRIDREVAAGFEGFSRAIEKSTRLARFKGFSTVVMLEPTSPIEKRIRLTFRLDYKTDLRYTTVVYADATTHAERVCMTVSRNPKTGHDRASLQYTDLDTGEDMVKTVFTGQEIDYQEPIVGADFYAKNGI